MRWVASFSFAQLLLLCLPAMSYAFRVASRASARAFGTQRGALLRAKGGFGGRLMASVQSPAPAVSRLGDPAAFLNDIDVFIFDCDGVIWRGDSLIEKVPAVLEQLRKQGKR
jgi:hypothetical protein